MSKREDADSDGSSKSEKAVEMNARTLTIQMTETIREIRGTSTVI